MNACPKISKILVKNFMFIGTLYSSFIKDVQEYSIFFKDGTKFKCFSRGSDIFVSLTIKDAKQQFGANCVCII